VTPVAPRVVPAGIANVTAYAPVKAFWVNDVIIVRFWGLLVGDACKSLTRHNISRRASSTVVETIVFAANAVIVFYINYFSHDKPSIPCTARVSIKLFS
jgi:hypothetical protein